MALNWTQIAPHTYSALTAGGDRYQLFGATGHGGDLFVQLTRNGQRIGEYIGYDDAEDAAEHLAQSVVVVVPVSAAPTVALSDIAPRRASRAPSVGRRYSLLRS